MITINPQALLIVTGDFGVYMTFGGLAAEVIVHDGLGLYAE